MPDRVAILAAFPLHLLPGFDASEGLKQHFATWLPQLARIYAAQPHFEFHWIVISKAFRSPERHQLWGQTFHCLPAGKGGMRAPSLYREERKRLQQLLREIRPALVHGWGTEDVYAFAAVRSGFPNLVSMQGILTYYMLRNRMGARDYLQAALEYYVLHTADRITVESEWGREVLLRRNSRAQIDLVEYGVDDLFLDVAWNPDPARPVALFVGTISPRKGVQDLVAAFAHPSLAGVELRIIGNGPQQFEEALRARSSPNVKWLGRLPRNEIAGQMSQAWALFLPTRADTSPNVVKEARVIGLPVITTPYGGQTTYVKEGVTGFLVEPGDVSALVKAAGRLFSSFERCQTLGQALREEHRRMLHPQETANRFLNLYRSMIEGG